MNHVALLKQGVAAWNKWRRDDPDTRANLKGADLRGADLRGAILNGADLRGANLSGTTLLSEANLRRADLSGANLRQAILSGTNLSRAILNEANLCLADISRAFLRGADLRGAILSGTNLSRAILSEANLSEANLSEANLTQANLRQANLGRANLSRAILSGAMLLETDLTDADLTGCRVYGVSAWDLKLGDRTKQQNLVITRAEPEITVDNIEVAQFIYLLLHNQKIRDVIDTITSKAVLILGRFTDERKAVLDAIREELRRRDYLPILFDFPISTSLDVTETIKVLAGLARFVIADITDATEVRVELHNIVPNFTSLPIQLILLRGHPEFVSLPHLTKYSWVLPIFEYYDREHLLSSLDKSIVGPAEDMARKLRRRSRRLQTKL